MPLCNGLEATQRIRHIEIENPSQDLPLSHQLNNARIPILAVSASVYDSDVGACVRAGMDGFVNKPVDVKLLNRLLLCCLNKKLRQERMMSETGERQEGAWFDDYKGGKQAF
jgi:CheY-like chemotaxis protein